jgi:hypothetical protein
MGLWQSVFKRFGTVEEPTKPAPWLADLARALGTVARASDGREDEGVIVGTVDDRVDWTLRVLTRIDADGDGRRDQVHVLWQSRVTQIDDVVLVFGSSSHDASVWSGLDRGGPLVRFVEKAAPFQLPHPLAAPWHALTVDPVLAARVLTPAVVVRIEEWRAKAPTYDSWIRAWVGGSSVRLESWLVDPDTATYRRLIDLGVELTRATCAAIGGSSVSLFHQFTV